MWVCTVFPPQVLRGVLWEDVFLRVRLWEFQQVNVEKAVEQFHKLLHSGRTAGLHHGTTNAPSLHHHCTTAPLHPCLHQT